MWLVHIARDSEIEKGLKVAEMLKEKEKEKVGEKEQEKGQQMVPESWKAKVEAWEVDSNMSEILFPGHLIQVGGGRFCPRAEKKNRFLHRLEISRSRVTLGGWQKGLHLGQGADFWDGFFATLEGGGV